MNLAVVGAGPVGQLLAATLQSGGSNVALVEIDSHRRSVIESHGMTTAGAIELSVEPQAILSSIQELEDRPVDACFVAVKAPATSLVAGAIADSVDDRATVVSWQNGIDTERTLSDHIDAERIVRAVVNYGVSLAEDESVFVAFDHPPHPLRELVSEGHERAEQISECLTAAGMESRRSENLEQSVWQKAVLNAALNPVCALTGLTIRDVWNDAFGGSLARNVLRESISVARANEILLGSGFHRYALDYLDRAGSHRPSMLLDMDAGRRTEIDFINGKIVEYGEIAGVSTPYNETLVALVKSAERSSRMAARSTKEEKK